MPAPDSAPSPETSHTPTPEVPPRRPSDPGQLRLWLRDVLVSVAVSFLIITFVYQPVRVEGTSMLPGLQNHDRLFINKFAYHFERISRGDVVVFHYPLNPKLSYIKRVIALPGDHIRIVHGQVYLNGKKLNEPYVPARYRDTRSMAEMTIPPNEYFVMGDHRNISDDSRDFGPVPRNFIYGKASFVYWPADNVGEVR